MSQSATVIHETVTVYDKAREALDKSGGDKEKAVSMFQRWLNNDNELAGELTEPLIYLGIVGAVARALSGNRGDTYNGHSSGTPEPKPDRAIADGGLIRLGQSIRLMAFQLSDGTRLGDALPAQVLDYSETYLKQGRTMVERGTWLQLVAGACKDPKRPVSKQLTEGDLEHFQKKAAKETGK